ncbi:MAG: DUF308 domain-containing protein [Bacilli bacterium]|nr:DUF308 domain-containing protein [Bacilli bacterium]
MKKFIVHKTVEDYRKMLNFSIFLELLILIAGCSMLFIKNLDIKTVGYICGGICFVYCINVLFKFLKKDGAKLYRFNWLFALIHLALGLLIILVPYTVNSFVVVIFGVYLIAIGSNKVNYAVWFKIADDSSWFLTMFIGIMLVVFGFLIIINPFANLTLIQLISYFIILASVLDLTDTIMIKRRAERIIKLFW